MLRPQGGRSRGGGAASFRLAGELKGPLHQRFSRRQAARVALTFAISAAGGLVAHVLGVPAAFIAGGLTAVTAASLAGVNTDVPAGLRPPVYVILGIYAGSGVTRETLHQMQTWPASFVILGASLVALIGGSYWWLHGRCGWDRNASLLASLPGALSFVMAAAEDLKVDMKKVAISQSLRVILLVELIPLLAMIVGHSGSVPGSAVQADADLADLALMLGAGTAAGFLLERLRLPGGWILGALFSMAALLLTGLVEGTLPAFLVIPSTIAMGAIAGSRLRPGDWSILLRLLKPSLVAFAIALAVSLIAAVAVTLLLGVNFLQAVMAFAPGALETLIILAHQMNVDPAYVAAHHVVRFVALALTVPLLARWLARRPRPDDDC